MIRLPFLFPRMKVNVLIRSITRHTGPDSEWPIIKPQLRRALEIRRELSHTHCWN